MSAAMKFVEKMRNNFKKAVNLLKLKIAPKYLAVFFAVLVFVGIGLIIPQGIAHAGILDSVGDWVMNNVIYRIIYFIFWILFLFAYWIAYFGAGLLNTTLNPEIMNQVLNNTAITTGWTIFRDIANLFFILILLFIAIGTIVRSQSYNLKNLLPKLIIAVFLINFSNVIAGVIIDFGNIFMYGVLKWMSCGAGNNTCSSDFFSGLMNVIDGFNTKYKFTSGLTSPSAQDAIGMMIATIYTFIYALILMALSTFLIIRTVAFALLIILSPLLAFTGEVFPGLQELSGKWWKNLVNYTLFGPIFALLLYISGLIAQGTLITVSGPFWGSTNPDLGTFGTLYVTIIQNIIPLIFLIAIIPITQELGIAGANAVLGATVGLGTKLAGGLMSRTLAKGNFIPGSSYIGKGARYVDKELFGGHVGRSYDKVKNWANKTPVGKVVGWAEKKAFGETKTLGQYKGMVARTLSPELWKKSIAHYMQEADDEAYKIPLGAKPDERRKFEMVYAHKKYQEGSQAGLYDNPVSASDSAAKKYLEGDNLVMEEIVERDIATKSKVSKFMEAMNRARGLKEGQEGFYSNDEKGVSKFLLDYAKIVGTENASIFGQRIGYLERKDGKHDTEKIAYYDENTKEHKIRDLSKEEDYDKYIVETKNQMAEEKENRLKTMDTADFVEDRKNAEGVYNPKAAGIKFIIEDVTEVEINKKIQGVPTAKQEKYRDMLDSALNFTGTKGSDNLARGELNKILTRLEKINKEARAKGETTKVFDKAKAIEKLVKVGDRFDKILKGVIKKGAYDESGETET